MSISPAPHSSLPPPPGAMGSKSSTAALLSLIFGSLGICTGGLTALPGLILGIVAMIKISNSNGAMRGNGMAIAGTIVSAMCLLCCPFSVGLLLPAVAKARESAKTAVVFDALRKLSRAQMLYANDHQDRSAPPDNWIEALRPYAADVDKLVVLPHAEKDGRAFAMNANVDQGRIAKLRDPANTVLLFEVVPGSPLSGGPELLPPKPQYRGGYFVLFTDGHTELVPREGLNQLVWEYKPKKQP